MRIKKDEIVHKKRSPRCYGDELAAENRRRGLQKIHKLVYNPPYYLLTESEPREKHKRELTTMQNKTLL